MYYVLSIMLATESLKMIKAGPSSEKHTDVSVDRFQCNIIYNVRESTQNRVDGKSLIF